MPRFKAVDYSPRFLPVDLRRQLTPGTFEHASAPPARSRDRAIQQDAQKSADEHHTQKHKRQLEKLRRDAQQIGQSLEAHPQDRTGSKGKVRLSNRTDNESAKMATGKGVIQGYTGVAAVEHAGVHVGAA